MLKIISQFYVHTSFGTLVLLADWYQQQESKHEVSTEITDLTEKLVSSQHSFYTTELSRHQQALC